MYLEIIAEWVVGHHFDSCVLQHSSNRSEDCQHYPTIFLRTEEDVGSELGPSLHKVGSATAKVWGHTETSAVSTIRLPHMLCDSITSVDFIRLLQVLVLPLCGV